MSDFLREAQDLARRVEELRAADIVEDIREELEAAYRAGADTAAATIRKASELLHHGWIVEALDELDRDAQPKNSDLPEDACGGDGTYPYA